MRTLFRIFIGATILTSLNRLHAQGDINLPGQALGLTIGYRLSTILDQNTSRLVYKSSQTKLGLSWQKNNDKYYYSGRVEVVRGNLTARKYPDRSITFLEEDVHDNLTETEVPMSGNLSTIGISLAYLRNLNPGHKLSPFVGAQLSEEANYSQGFVTPGLMNSISFAPAIDVQYRASEKSYLYLGITIPIASVITRSAYHNSVSLPEAKKLAGFWKNGTQFESMESHREMNIRAGYGLQIGKKMYGGLEYTFRSLNNRSPRILGRLDHEVNLTFRYLK